MAKVKVKRKDDKGAEQEIEVEESEVVETDVRVPDPGSGQKPPEKTLTQSEVNKLMADQRREYEAKIKAGRDEFDTFRKGVEDKEKAANDAAAKKVEELRKDLPEPITKLLEKLTPIEQLEWLSDPANVVEKKNIPPLPPSAPEGGRTRKPISIV